MAWPGMQRTRLMGDDGGGSPRMPATPPSSKRRRAPCTCATEGYCAAHSGPKQGSPGGATVWDETPKLPPGDCPLVDLPMQALSPFSPSAARVFAASSRHEAAGSRGEEGHRDVRSVIRHDIIPTDAPPAPWWQWPPPSMAAASALSSHSCGEGQRHYRMLADDLAVSPAPLQADVDDLWGAHPQAETADYCFDVDDYLGEVDGYLGEVADESQGFQPMESHAGGRRSARPIAAAYAIGLVIAAVLVLAVAFGMAMRSRSSDDATLARRRRDGHLRDPSPPSPRARRRACKSGYPQDDPSWMSEDADCTPSPPSSVRIREEGTTVTTTAKARHAPTTATGAEGTTAVATTSSATKVASTSAPASTRASAPRHSTTARRTSTLQGSRAAEATTTAAPTRTGAAEATTTASPTRNTDAIPPWSDPKIAAAESGSHDHDYYKRHSLFDAAGLTPTTTIVTEAAASGTQPIRTPGAGVGPRCFGSVAVGGLGDLTLVGAYWNVPGARASSASVSADRRVITPMLTSRSYLAEACPTGGGFEVGGYALFRLLGKTLSYTADVSAAGCGCNAAVYLVSMPQNADPSACSDYYCDAANVCGVQCAEIDLMEANRRAWHTTLHGRYDRNGVSTGLGGRSGPRAWTAQDYGPDPAACINTLLPFRVEVSFPVGADGNLEAVRLRLSQTLPLRPRCDRQLQIANYANTPELRDALWQGMALVTSYWRSDDMGWLDGAANGAGCTVENEPCGSTAVYDFSVEDTIVF